MKIAGIISSKEEAEEIEEIVEVMVFNRRISEIVRGHNERR